MDSVSIAVAVDCLRQLGHNRGALVIGEIVEIGDRSLA
jgi:hypothetical protein